jgi:hypothetical protein
MKLNKWEIMEPEAGEALIWKDRNDDDWIVEYANYEYDHVTHGPQLITRYSSVYGLKNAIVCTRSAVKDSKHNLEYLGYDKPFSSNVYFQVPFENEYIDITSDADAIQVLFQYDNYK